MATASCPERVTCSADAPECGRLPESSPPYIFHENVVNFTHTGIGNFTPSPWPKRVRVHNRVSLGRKGVTEAAWESTEEEGPTTAVPKERGVLEPVPCKQVRQQEKSDRDDIVAFSLRDVMRTTAGSIAQGLGPTEHAWSSHTQLRDHHHRKRIPKYSMKNSTTR